MNSLVTKWNQCRILPSNWTLEAQEPTSSKKHVVYQERKFEGNLDLQERDRGKTMEKERQTKRFVFPESGCPAQVTRKDIYCADACPQLHRLQSDLFRRQPSTCRATHISYLYSPVQLSAHENEWIIKVCPTSKKVQKNRKTKTKMNKKNN